MVPIITTFRQVRPTPLPPFLLDSFQDRCNRKSPPSLGRILGVLIVMAPEFPVLLMVTSDGQSDMGYRLPGVSADRCDTYPLSK